MELGLKPSHSETKAPAFSYLEQITNSSEHGKYSKSEKLVLQPLLS